MAHRAFELSRMASGPGAELEAIDFGAPLDDAGIKDDHGQPRIMHRVTVNADRPY